MDHLLIWIKLKINLKLKILINIINKYIKYKVIYYYYKNNSCRYNITHIIINADIFY
jgi:hypothetical protein